MTTGDFERACAGTERAAAEAVKAASTISKAAKQLEKALSWVTLACDSEGGRGGKTDRPDST